MISTQPSAHAAAEVEVELTGSAPDDAHAVFGALHTAYASDRPREDMPQAPDSDGRTMVWCATYDTTDVREEPRPVALTSPVTAVLQGGYHAVDGLCRTLSSAFAVRVLGTACGDQEEEVELRLASR